MMRKLFTAKSMFYLGEKLRAKHPMEADWFSFIFQKAVIGLLLTLSMLTVHFSSTLSSSLAPSEHLGVWGGGSCCGVQLAEQLTR